MREKPIMGTRLVPSIENVEGCYKYGGRWDRIEKICYEQSVPEHFPRDEYFGCTAPIKGISVCWGASPLRNHVKFVDHILSATGDIVHSESFKLNSTSETGKYEAVRDYFYIRESGNKKLFERKKFVCINPGGRIVDCNSKDAIFTNKGKNITAIAHSMRRYRKHIPLGNVKPQEYKPMDLEYKKGRQMEVIHLTDDLPVLMRKDRDEKNDRDYFPADRRESLYPPLDKMEVPSIESIRHCFNNGGYWDGIWNVCIRGNCVGPHKGVECHFSAYETEDVKYDPDTREEEWDDRYEPSVYCKIVGGKKPDKDFWDENRLIWDSSYDGYFSDYWRPSDFDGYRFPDDDATAEKAAKEVAIEMMDNVVDGRDNCFTPEGRKVKHTNPRAVCAPREKVLKVYSKKQLKT